VNDHHGDNLDLDEPSSRSRLERTYGPPGNRGIDKTKQLIFDVLYEAGEPLTVEEIARRTFDLAPAAVKYHARRARLAHRDQARAGVRRARGLEPVLDPDDDHTMTVERAWPLHVRRQCQNGLASKTLLRDEADRYKPNPAKPPGLLVDAGVAFHCGAQYPPKKVPYTPENARKIAAIYNTSRQTHIAVKMNVPMFLDGLSTTELRAALVIVAREFAFSGAVAPGRDLGELGVDAKELRRRIRPLYDRITDGNARAALLAEIARRAYAED
jgi:hypothetical protein